MVQREFRLCEVERLQDIWISDMGEEMRFYNHKEQPVHVYIFVFGCI